MLIWKLWGGPTLQFDSIYQAIWLFSWQSLSSLWKTLSCSGTLCCKAHLNSSRGWPGTFLLASYWKKRSSHLFPSMFFPLSKQFLAQRNLQSAPDKAGWVRCWHSLAGPPARVSVGNCSSFYNHLANYSPQDSWAGKDAAEKNNAFSYWCFVSALIDGF